MKFDYQSYRYPSRRETVFARNGMVCTSQPLAAQAGLDILKAGGNAIDAAVATAAALTVLEPTSNGIGGDAFALVWMEQDKALKGLNASGGAPSALTAKRVRAMGYQEMARRGWLPVTVPGAPSAWAELTKTHGRLSLAENLQPAIRYAREGYPVSPTVAKLWAAGFSLFDEIRAEAAQAGTEKDTAWLRPWFDHFAPGNRAPKPGEIWKSEEMANTLEQIASTAAKAFYQGQLADAIDRFSGQTGGFLRKSDLTEYWCEWVNPIHINYHGFDVWEIPPNGDGIIALMALNMLKNFRSDGGYEGRQSPELCHRQIEAIKLAFADGHRYVTDPSRMMITEEELLSAEYGRRRAGEIGTKAQIPEAGDPRSGGTVYLCTADAEGNMVSFIQSNYHGFGSGVVVPGTGISLQNRGFSFSLDESHVNVLAPGKKAFHTIIPGFLTRDGEAVGPFGLMGAFMQPQGHVQLLMNLIDFGLNPQEALDAPRWQWIRGLEIEVEQSFPAETASQLAQMGHHVTYATDSISFGRGELILRSKDGVLCGACEPRAAGSIAAW